MGIEVEARSFISPETHERLLAFFKQNARMIKEDCQETSYLDCDQDLRIQRNDFYSKVWLKKGKMHDDHREEIEIRFERSQFEAMEKLCLALGFDIQIKWFRKRFEFQWDDVTVCLDHTRGYGHIIELEKISSDEDKEEEYKRLNQRLKSLGVEITPKEEFDKRFLCYKENWKELV